jgi:putative nucleotidyltransferase with HDIG domain
VSYKILIVDDEPANLRLLERLFRRDFEVITALSGSEALELLGQHDVALLITDQRMPGMTGIELLKSTVSLRPHMVRIILTGYTDMSALVEAINCGHVYKYVTKPWNNDELRLTVERALEHYETTKSRHELEQANQRLSLRLQEMTSGGVRAAASALEAKDENLYGHARRVRSYATAIGRRMRLDVAKLEDISLAAFLHDIGKIGTPESLLMKPAGHTDEERTLLQLHSECGARILGEVPEMAEIADAVRYHHEHFDGTGYPLGLKGERIPLASRIILVADAYDVMTSPRPFRNASNHDAAIAQLRSESGKQFDPSVVDAFCGLEALGEIRRCLTIGYWGPRPSTNPLPNLRLPLAALVREVKADPLLAASVLRYSNANCDAVSGTADIWTACAQIVQEQVRDVEQPITRDHQADEDDELLKHSLRCAVAAEQLAERSKVIAPAEAYTLGLLHNIGEFLLRALFPEEMENILWLADSMRTEREVAAFGLDHCQIGQWILESCGLPRYLTAAVQAHHDVPRSNDRVALLLYVADAIARSKEPEEMMAHDALSANCLAGLRLTRGDIVEIHGQVSAAIEDSITVMRPSTLSHRPPHLYISHA